MRKINLLFILLFRLIAQGQDLEIFEKESYIAPPKESEYLPENSVIWQSTGHSGLANIGSLDSSGNKGFDYFKVSNFRYQIYNSIFATQFGIDAETFHYNYLLNEADQSDKFYRLIEVNAMYYKGVRLYNKNVLLTRTLRSTQYCWQIGLDENVLFHREKSRMIFLTGC